MSQYEVCSLVDTTARREKEGLFADVRKMLPKSISRRLSRQIPFCVEIFVTGGKKNRPFRRVNFPLKSKGHPTYLSAFH